MSVNSLPKEICVTPAELYLMIYTDRSLWYACDTMEKSLDRWGKASPKRMKAILAVWFSLLKGATRAEMIEEVQKLGYRQSFAEKFVDGEIGRYKEKFGKTPLLRIKSGTMLKEMSVKNSSKEAKPGRPPRIYMVERTPEAEKIEKTDRLVFYAFLLSGSYIRLCELVFRLMKEQTALIDILSGTLSPLGEVLKKAVAENKIEEIEEEIKKWYEEFMKPIREEAEKLSARP